MMRNQVIEPIVAYLSLSYLSQTHVLNFFAQQPRIRVFNSQFLTQLILLIVSLWFSIKAIKPKFLTFLLSNQESVFSIPSF
jgi:hypothetical protein